MPLILIRNDITRMPVDMLVCPTDPAMSGSGGLDAAIHKCAGPELEAACRKLAPCPVGEVRLSQGYRLPCRYVLHAAGPGWQGGDHGEEALLRQVYLRCAEIAASKKAHTLALPLISAGNLGFPRDLALRIATDVLKNALPDDITAFLVLFDKPSLLIGQSLFDSVAEYITDRYAETHASVHRSRNKALCPPTAHPAGGKFLTCEDASIPEAYPDLLRRLKEADESFTQALLRAIDERGMTDAQCYKRANIDRKHFSKIRSNFHYHPRKETVLALAIALEMDISETEALLQKAGYALSPGSKSDIIVEYFITHGEHDIFRINEALFAFDQTPLGG